MGDGFGAVGRYGTNVEVMDGAGIACVLLCRLWLCAAWPVVCGSVFLCSLCTMLCVLDMCLVPSRVIVCGGQEKVMIAVSVGHSHSICISDEDLPYCWGFTHGYAFIADTRIG